MILDDNLVIESGGALFRLKVADVEFSKVNHHKNLPRAPILRGSSVLRAAEFVVPFAQEFLVVRKKCDIVFGEIL